MLNCPDFLQPLFSPLVLRSILPTVFLALSPIQDIGMMDGIYLVNSWSRIVGFIHGDSLPPSLASAIVSAGVRPERAHNGLFCLREKSNGAIWECG